jgi:hypothetical protein
MMLSLAMRKHHEMQDVFAMYFVGFSSRNALTEGESLCATGTATNGGAATKAASLRGA